MKTTLFVLAYLSTALLCGNPAWARNDGSPLLIRELASTSVERRAAAAHRLAERGALVVPELLEAIDSGPRTARSRALDILGGMDGTEAGRAIADVAVHSPHPALRRRAIHHLRQRDPAPVRSHILPLTIQSTNAATRRQAIEAVRAVGDPGCIEALIRRMETQATETRSTQVSLGINLSRTSFQGYDDSLSTTTVVNTDSGPRTLTNRHSTPVIRHVSVQTNVLVSAATILTELTGQDYGNNPVRWRHWLQQYRNQRHSRGD